MPDESQKKSDQKSRRKVVDGVVVSDKMEKSIAVGTERRVLHQRYKKNIRRKTKLHAHDENNDARTGDTVRIAETRPLSKLKRWKLVEVLQRGE